VKDFFQEWYIRFIFHVLTTGWLQYAVWTLQDREVQFST